MNANDLWFTARGAGLSALLVLTIATVLGSLGSVGARSAATRVVLQYVHRTAAFLGLGLVTVHVATLLLDAKSHISLAGALVPFAAQYRPNAVALGSLALYLLLLVAALGAARGRMASSHFGSRTWRATHSLAYLAWALAVVHGLLAGTDRHQRWVVLLTVASVAAVLIALVVRVLAVEDQPRRTIGPTATPVRTLR